MTIRHAIAAILATVALAGCFDSDCPLSETLVNEHGVHAWVSTESWGTWARHADRDDIEAGIDAGTLAPIPSQDGSECYALIADGPEPPHICVTEIDCVEVLGRPTDTLEMVESDCSVAGPWQAYEAANAIEAGVSPVCYALINGYAVEISDDPR
jgi:hypothetical protein